MVCLNLPPRKVKPTQQLLFSSNMVFKYILDTTELNRVKNREFKWHKTNLPVEYSSKTSDVSWFSLKKAANCSSVSLLILDEAVRGPLGLVLWDNWRQLISPITAKQQTPSLWLVFCGTVWRTWDTFRFPPTASRGPFVRDLHGGVLEGLRIPPRRAMKQIEICNTWGRLFPDIVGRNRKHQTQFTNNNKGTSSP